MPKLTDISYTTESDPENNQFLNKTGPKRFFYQISMESFNE